MKQRYGDRIYVGSSYPLGGNDSLSLVPCLSISLSLSCLVSLVPCLFGYLCQVPIGDPSVSPLA